ncbi:MAG TPA: sugar transferase [Myxococcota bacterium]|jgi:exopolysaccharide biosynthesis polyprenyl glycosylphosphotransferase
MRYYLLNLYLRRVLMAVLVDASCFLFAAIVSWFLLEPDFPVRQYATATAGGVLASFVALYYTGAYGLTTLGSGRRTVESVFAAMGTAFVLALVVYFSLRTPPRAMEALAHTAAIYFPLLLGGRLGFRMVSALPRFSQHVLVIGSSDLGVAIAKAMRERSNLGARLVGFLSDEATHQRATIDGVPVLGKVHEIEKIVDHEGIDRIVVASKSRSEYFPSEELLAAKLGGRYVESGVAFYERITGRVYLRDLRPSYLIFTDGFRVSPLQTWLKLALDVTVSAVGLVLVAPVLAACALAIRLDSPGPIFYRQERVGQRGRLFRVCKLRSMRHRAEDETGAVFSREDDDRITRVGRILRKTRLDELPQLWNVLVGDMSLVGPRPERPEFIDALSERYPYFRLRSVLKPGLTGWAQIRHGYVNDVDGFEEKLALDLYYMKYRSFVMDLLILWKTAKTMVLLHGV